MVEAAEKFKRYLQRHKIDSFEREELGDEHESVIFRSTVECRDSMCRSGSFSTIRSM